ncbi:hypothetical protein CM15mP94_1410 [bacterium]|nr:MAG: hypothetical protein CM15mP94_1410 [bacterium]
MISLFPSLIINITLSILFPTISIAAPSIASFINGDFPSTIKKFKLSLRLYTGSLSTLNPMSSS